MKTRDHLLLRIAATWVAAPALGFYSAPAAAAATSRDVTFIATSDVHYDAFENEDRNDRVRDTLRAINAVTNLSWPDTLGGGAIAKPRGVVVLGDLIDDGDRVLLGKHQTPRQWHQFAADFGLDGTDGLLNFPVFETWGNHDGPPAGAEKLGFSFQAKLKERNARRQQRGWLTNLSTNGLHYSWDWDDVHFVMLGLYPADRQNPLIPRYSPVWHDPQGALSFLKDDLAKCVGTSGRPVVLMSHCGFDTDWWHTNDWRAVYEAAKPFQVILYLYGHSGTGLRMWAPPGESKPWQCLNTGQTENGFFVLQISGDKLRAAYRRKHWQEEKLPDGKPKRTWDGTWEWQHVLDKSLTATATAVSSAPKPGALPIRKLMDTPLRDTSICRGPDGVWYLTGTVEPFWGFNEGIRLWKSPDLTNWTGLGFVWKYGGSPWHKPYLEKKKPLWAPEVHFLKGTFWLTYSIPGWDGTGKTSGCGLLKSTTGKPEGPYEDMHPGERLGDEIDASLFQDDDGTVYFLWHSGKIARMKLDMSGLAEPYHWLKTTTSDPNPKHHSPLCAGIFGKDSFDHVGYEGMFLFKKDGRYYLTCAEHFDGRYSCTMTTSTNIYGPYGPRYEAIPHGGHNTFFTDERGQWWSTYFGSDGTAPWQERPGVLPVEFDAEGRVRPKAQ